MAQPTAAHDKMSTYTLVFRWVASLICTIPQTGYTMPLPSVPNLGARNAKSSSPDRASRQPHERREGLVSRRILVSVLDRGIPPSGDRRIGRRKERRR